MSAKVRPPHLVSNADALRDLVLDMRVEQISPRTQQDRIDLLRRFARHLDANGGRLLLAATEDDVRSFQRTFAHLAPASIDVYCRHLKAFYRWAQRRRLITGNPTDGMIMPRVPKGLPHPTSADELRTILACTRGPLRLAYVLAAFAGLRRGEICALRWEDITTTGPAVALIHGKGRKERRVPLLAPVMTELWETGSSRRAGWVVTLPDGRPYPPGRLSADSTRHLKELRVTTTLHSMRGTFATDAARVTRDPLFVRDLLGHESVQTTEIYMGSSMVDAHLRLAMLATAAEEILTPPPQERPVSSSPATRAGGQHEPAPGMKCQQRAEGAA